MPADDLKGLIAWLKVNPGKASAGTAGVGAPDHVGAALFQTLTGTRFGFVPYRGAGPAVQDLVAGQLDIMFENGVFALRLNGFLERTTRAVKPPARPDWVHEIKHDGCPLVVLFTRRGDRPCPGGGYTAIHSALPPGLSWSNTNVSRRQPASNRFTPRTRRA